MIENDNSGKKENNGMNGKGSRSLQQLSSKWLPLSFAVNHRCHSLNLSVQRSTRSWPGCRNSQGSGCWSGYGRKTGVCCCELLPLLPATAVKDIGSYYHEVSWLILWAWLTKAYSNEYALARVRE
jgi:hypothetical protein